MDMGINSYAVISAQSDQAAGRMALVGQPAACPRPAAHHPHQSFVPFRRRRPARLPRSPAAAAAAPAEPDFLPQQLEQVGAVAQSLTDSAAAAGVAPTTLLAAAAVVGELMPSCTLLSA